MTLPPIPSVEQLASGMFLLMLSRIEEHAATHENKTPRFFVLHKDSCASFVAESYRRYGCIERVKFRLRPFEEPLDCPSLMGIPIILCSGEGLEHFDYYIDAAGEKQTL